MDADKDFVEDGYLNKLAFGPNGVRLPLFWLGLQLTQSGKDKVQGTVYFDDVRISDIPLIDEPTTPINKQCM